MNLRNKQKGFTIVELLIVIVVIAILAAISIVAFTGIQQRARDSERASDVSNIVKALTAYTTDESNTWPENGAEVKSVLTGYATANLSSDVINKIANNDTNPPTSSGGSTTYVYSTCPDSGTVTGAKVSYLKEQTGGIETQVVAAGVGCTIP